MNRQILCIWATTSCLAAMSLFGSEAQTNSPPVRLAIVSTDPAIAATADLLTASLSKLDRLELFERAEIEKVVREQSLSAVNRDYLKLGQVLGADGLLVLTTVAEGTNQFLQASLVAVKPGVVIDSSRAPWPLPKSMDWQRFLGLRISPLLPKLTVLAKDAVPISVVNFRSAVRGRPNQALEQELTVLLIHRLVREREVFVLERQHLSDVLFEKELQPESESPFWTGRYLLDGLLDRDGFDPGRVTVNARLVSSQTTTAIPIELSGPRSNLTAVVESLTEKILASLHRSSESHDWRPAEEAAQYGEEAEWAMRWGMKPEALAASETAWALGERTKKIAMLRVRSCMDGVSTFFWNYSAELDKLPPVPDPSRLRPAIRALELFCEGASRFAATNGAPDGEWLQTGFDALDLASGLLENYHRVVEAREQARELLPQLRAVARQAAGLIPTNLYLNVPSGLTQPAWRQMDAWYRLKWRWGGLWYEKPEGAFPMYYQNLADGWRSADMPDTVCLPLIAWTWEDRRRIPALRTQLLDELLRSTDAKVRLEGCFLSVKLTAATFDGKLEESVQAWADEVWRQRQLLYDGQMDVSFQGKTIMGVQWVLRNKYRTFSDSFAVTNEPFAGFLTKLRKDYLLNAPAFNRNGYYSLFPNNNLDVYTPEVAQELAPLLEQFAQRLHLGPGDFNLVHDKATALTAIAAKSRGTNLSSALAPASAPAEPAFVVSLTEIPLILPGGDVRTHAGIRSAAFRFGRLWLLVSKQEVPGFDTRLGPAAAFVSVDLRSGKQETVWVPEQYGQPHNSFAVTEDSFYTTVSDRILRYRFKEKQWEAIPAPLQDATRITLLDERFYLTTPDSLLQFEPQTRTIQVLSSARRLPAQNVLDGVDWRLSPDFGPPEMFHAPGGATGLIINHRFFSRKPDEKEWSETRLPTCVGGWDIHPVTGSDRVLMEVNGNQTRARILEYHPDSGGFEELMEHRFPYDLRDPRADRVLGQPRYLWPKNVGLHGAFTVADGKALWVLAPRQWWQKDQPDSEVILLRFEPEFREPMIVKTRFDFQGRPSYLSSGRQGAPYLILLNTPQGLALMKVASTFGEGGVIGYWLLPKSILDAKMETLRSKVRAGEVARQEYERKLLAKFDLNKNGILNADELTAMHLDPACLEHDRADIDQDDNGALDVEEFLWFDANNNGVIESSEREAIRHFNGLLARRDLEKFDANHDGGLDPEEWRGFLAFTQAALVNQRSRKMPESFAKGDLSAFDRSHDGTLDAAEITEYLEQRFESLDLAAYGYSIAP